MSKPQVAWNHEDFFKTELSCCSDFSAELFKMQKYDIDRYVALKRVLRQNISVIEFDDRKKKYIFSYHICVPNTHNWIWKVYRFDNLKQAQAEYAVCCKKIIQSGVNYGSEHLR